MAPARRGWGGTRQARVRWEGSQVPFALGRTMERGALTAFRSESGEVAETTDTCGEARSASAPQHGPVRRVAPSANRRGPGDLCELLRAGEGRWIQRSGSVGPQGGLVLQESVLSSPSVVPGSWAQSRFAGPLAPASSTPLQDPAASTAMDGTPSLLSQPQSLRSGASTRRFGVIGGTAGRSTGSWLIPHLGVMVVCR